jgi:phytoene synthase
MIARTRARNFYYAFRLLDGPRRDAICAIYAFMRRCDDLSDEYGATVEALESWRAHLNNALEGRVSGDPVWPAFYDTVRRHQIPHSYFHAMIDGVSSDLRRDLTRTSFATFDELYRYCYQVASVAGLSLMHILGAATPDALARAEKCGVAFQLTNILRDIAEDSARGRLYIPIEDMQRFGVTGFAESPALLELIRFEAARARAYYAEAAPLPKLVPGSGAASLWALIEIYSRLLDRIEQSGLEVLRTRIRLSTLEKLAIMAQALWRFR